MKDILYFNTVEDIRLIDALRISNKDKELPNQIILTIQSAGPGVGTPIFSKDGDGYTVFTHTNEIGTKFILDGKEISPDDFQVVHKSKWEIDYNFFGLQFEDSDEHTLKVNLVNSIIPEMLFGIKSGDYPGCGSDIKAIVIDNSITSIDSHAFYLCENLTSVIIGNSVTIINSLAFHGCTNLTSLTLGTSITRIDEAFMSCSSLDNITSLATTAPTLRYNAFRNIKTNGTLHVPSGSDYSSWMSTDNYYLGSYNWTKVEDA